MFEFVNEFGGGVGTAIIGWLIAFAGLFICNELGRRYKWVGFGMFFILPVVLTVLWLTALKETTYMDWFHLFKVYSSTAGCIIFWLIRFVQKKDKLTGKVTWRLVDVKGFMILVPAILIINICEACIRDFEVYKLFNEATGTIGYGSLVNGQDVATAVKDGGYQMIGGSWNILNGIAGLLNAITVTGWFGIKIRAEKKGDKSHDMLWPDMLWFWIIAYDVWNFAYTYNCLPNHAWYCGLALLIAPTLCAFTIGKGAWLQHRAQTLALWCMFAQTIPMFQDYSKFRVDSAYDPKVYTIISALALASNAAVFIYMVYKVIKKKKNPYTNDIYDDLEAHKNIAILADECDYAKV